MQVVYKPRDGQSHTRTRLLQRVKLIKNTHKAPYTKYSKSLKKHQQSRLSL